MDPFGNLLEETMRDEEGQSRRLELKRYRALAEIKTCHILYIGSRKQNGWTEYWRVKGKPVLMVSGHRRERRTRSND